MLSFDFGVLANAGVKLINAAGVHPAGAAIVGIFMLGAIALWVWSKK